MSIYDPLGLIAHLLMYVKILLQEIWRSGTAWDEGINDNSFHKWQIWLKVLPQVKQVAIPRCYLNNFDNRQNLGTQMHTFVDASEYGMVASCILRYEYQNSIQCALVASRSKVAPLKFVSIPRLELQAAVIGARLTQTVAKAMSLRISKRIFWTDSQDVLCWINSDHRKYSQFVAFRISEILDTTETNEWRWVPTKLNIADDATKWTSLPDLTALSRWFTGPDFLWHPENEWPNSSKCASSTNLELRAHTTGHHSTAEPIIQAINFSSWKRLLRVTAFVHRFLANCRRSLRNKPKLCGLLTSEELINAECFLLRLAQTEGYPEETSLLRKSPIINVSHVKNLLPKNSPLYRLIPRLDYRGVMRMRTRITACQYATYDTRHPIILPRNHPITKLIIAFYHQRYNHQNHESIINEIRQKYSISRLRTTYEQVRKTCQLCKNNSVHPRTPMMAELPDVRLAAFTRPFTYVGVDYFGPFLVSVGRRTEKRWGMLATCLTIRAIHIEVVSSLSTDSCIIAIRNFIARRGQPRKIYSDHGTNFVGAKRQLSELEAAIDQQLIMQEFTTPDTEWVFIPPLSPHMGGSWERLIRTVKTNLQKICPTKRPSDEVFRNLLTEIEHTVNSRPLTHVPIDDDSAPALTPNHFLIGSSCGIKPLGSFNDSGAALRQNWATSQVLANVFWKRWVTDYIPEITRRTKWCEYTKPIGLNDIVVITDPTLPRNCWPKGRVIGVHPGRDGLIRVATIRTAVGVYERPVTKLAVLDVRRVQK